MTAGGLVTSNDAALAVPDWPLSWGRLIPPLEGGIRYEFAHRALAALAAILSFSLALWTQLRESRRWMRKLAWSAFLAVLAQAALGGAVVKLVDPKLLAVSHASLAQIVFGLTVAVAAGHYRFVPQKNPVPHLAVAAIFFQTTLGAALQHHAIGLVPHLAGAAVATGIVMWAALRLILKHLDSGHYPPEAVVLLGLTGLQLFLGFAVYSALAATAGDPQPMPLMVWTSVAHLVVGTLVLAAAILLSMTDENKPYR